MVETNAIQNFEGKTILVVDDDEEIGSALAIALSFEGYSVFQATSGKSALSILDDHPINLIISDIEMPEGDGFFLLKEIQTRKKITPLVFISAHSDISSDSVKNMGALDLIRKPFDIVKLFSIISTLLFAKPIENAQK